MNARITVVTPSFNQAPFLDETIRSIVEQGYPDLEYLVLDGGSTDASVEVIRRHAAKISWWRSEKDRGQSAAINEGFKRATGTLLGWINSDDLLLPGSLALLGEAHAKQPDAIICGDLIFFDETGREKYVPLFGCTTRNLIDRWSQKGQIAQPSVFFPKAVFDKLGPLDESLRYCFDFDFFYKALKTTPVVYLEKPIARFRIHTLQKTTAEASRVFEEDRDVAFRHLDVFSEEEQRRLRAEYDLDVAAARFQGGRRRDGARALAASVRNNFAVAFRPRFLKALFYAVGPRALVDAVERRRLERHTFGKGWPRSTRPPPS